MKNLLGIAAFLVSIVVWADSPFELAGNIQDESGKALQGAQLSINGQVIESSTNGTFKVRPTVAEIYKITIKKAG